MYAHPDDESFGIAGTAMKLATAGHTTALLTLTRGDVGMWFGKERGSWTPAERVTADVVESIREIRPDVVCTFGPEGAGSEHDDHRAASFYAVRGFHRAALADQYPDRGAPHAAARLFFNASPLLPDLPFVAMTPTHTVDIREFQDRKAKAFECHKTQFKDRDRFYQMLERRGGKEFFHLAIDRGAAVPDPGDLPL